jgi:Protein of unknown function (DUF2934)
MEDEMARQTQNRKLKSDQDLEPQDNKVKSAAAPKLVSRVAHIENGVKPAGVETMVARDESIRERAYAFWIDEGQIHGRDKEHWLAAELEIANENAPKREGSKRKLS